ncbi:recombinase family protein, partial [Glutamicibacter sp. AGC84]
MHAGAEPAVAGGGAARPWRGRVYVDRGESSRVIERPQWTACLDHLRSGDTLIIRALDRVASTELMAIETIRDLGRRGVRLKSLTEPFLDVDTS